MSCDRFIKIPKLFLSGGGFWPFQITENPLYGQLYNIYSRCQTISYVCFILSLFINVIILIIKNDQPTRLFRAINVLIIVTETCVKLLLFKFKHVPNMCASIMNYESTIWASDDQEVKKCFQKKLSYCHKVNIAQFFLTLFTCVSFATASIVKLVASEDVISEFKDEPFMHDMWYPFQRELHMNWVIVINMFVVSQGAWFNPTTQTTFIMLMIFASARLQVLQTKLKKFDVIAEKFNGGNVFYTVKELIIEHQQAIRFVESLSERIKYVVLFEFVMNSISLASVTIQLAVVDSMSSVQSVLSIVCMVLVQIFILAWSGNEISIEFKHVPNMCASIMNYESTIWASDDQEVKKYFQKKVNYCHKINIAQFFLTIFTCVSFTIASIAKLMASEDVIAEFKDEPFMHDMWYPFQRELHMNWVVGINIFVISQGVWFNTTTQTTFIMLMIFASARLQILQIKLKKFDVIAEKYNGGNVFWTIKELIIEHQQAIRFVESLNERIKYVVLFEFVMNSISLASVTIQLVVVDSMSSLLSVLSIVCMVLVQIFILAWSGNEISIESLNVADAISSSNWTSQTREVKMLLIVMLARAQRPLGVNAGPFFQMSTKTALTTIKIAYSYMSLMMQNYEEQGKGN